MRRIWLLWLFIPLVMAACRTAATNTGSIGREVQIAGGSYTNVSVNELQAMLDNKDFVFVNVHIPYEGDIPGTDLSIPYDEIEANLNQLPADQHAKIVLYCRSGRMSQIAAETLVELGYTNVWNVEGGMMAWEQAGHRLEHR